MDHEQNSPIGQNSTQAVLKSECCKVSFARSDCYFRLGGFPRYIIAVACVRSIIMIIQTLRLIELKSSGKLIYCILLLLEATSPSSHIRMGELV